MLSDRFVEFVQSLEVKGECGIAVDYLTPYRSAIKRSPLFEKAVKKHKRPVEKSWRTDKCYIEREGEWECLHVALDVTGNTLGFLSSVCPIKVRQTRYLISIVDMDHQAIKPRSRSTRGLTDFHCSSVTPSGIKARHMDSKR